MSLSEYYAEQKKKAETGKAFFLGLLPLLKEKGVAKMSVPYNGSGDSGEIDYPVFYDGESNIVVIAEFESQTAVDAGYDVMEAAHGGWEINEGSFGEIVLYVESGKLMIENNVRYEESRYDEQEA
jgi:hypothetical protein